MCLGVNSVCAWKDCAARVINVRWVLCVAGVLSSLLLVVFLPIVLSSVERRVLIMDLPAFLFNSISFFSAFL